MWWEWKWWRFAWSTKGKYTAFDHEGRWIQLIIGWHLWFLIERNGEVSAG